MLKVGSYVLVLVHNAGRISHLLHNPFGFAFFITHTTVGRCGFLRHLHTRILALLAVSQCLNQTLQQLFARVIEILGQLWILLEHFDHDGWQVLVQCHLCARILGKAVIALYDVL